MTDVDEKQLTVVLARQAVTQVAPDELSLFEPVSEAYLKRPKTTLEGKDDMLGFGVGEAVAMLTPIILAVATDVATYVLTEFAKPVAEEGAGGFRALIRRLLAKLRLVKEPPRKVPPLTQDQLAQVRKLAIRSAARFPNLSAEQANMLADTLVARLALAS